jgi:hypothetical protein
MALARAYRSLNIQTWRFPARAVINGASNGHLAQFGAKAYRGLSTYSPASGAWAALASPAHNRDHFDAVLIGSQLVIASGRDTPRGCTGSSKDPPGFNCTGKPNIFHFTTAPTEIYDISAGEWAVGTNITTPRAGSMAVAVLDATAISPSFPAMATAAVHGLVVVAGGERDTQQEGFRTVEAYSPEKDAWTTLPSMLVGRHTGGLMAGRNSMVAASGVGHMGGSPLLTDTEEWTFSK